jgi:hypothetical protein
MLVALDEGPGPPIKYQYPELTKLHHVVSQLIRCCDVSSKTQSSQSQQVGYDIYVVRQVTGLVLSSLTFNPLKPNDNYSRQTMRWSLRGVNILSAVWGKYRACRWTEDFLLVSAKMT